MVDNTEFELTESFVFENTTSSSETFQTRLLLKAYKLAVARGFPNILCSHFYIFRDDENHNELVIECDILDTTENKIAIECYLYKRHTTTFIAKSFSIFIKNTDLF